MFWSYRNASARWAQRPRRVARQQSRFGAGFQPCLEALEDRTLLSQSAVQVLDINPGTFSSNPAGLIDFNGTLIFAATTAKSGTELWKSDGTAAGTLMLKDINAGAGSSNPTGFTVFSGFVYFAATTASNGSELWRTDGTTAGTTLVKDINPGTASSTPSDLTVFNNALYFAANDGIHGNELWKSDGTPGGTNLFDAINPTLGAGSNPSLFTVSGGKLFFQANDGSHGTELWVTDGTVANTQLVADINPATSPIGSSSPNQLTDFNGKLYFSADDGTHGRELWVSDGTSLNTHLVADIFPGSTGGVPNSSQPVQLTVSNGKLFFAATDGPLPMGHGNQLWVTDGVNPPALVGSPINPTGDASPAALTDVNGTLFFRANDGVHGVELWKSNGITNTLVADINTNASVNGGSSTPTGLTNFKGTLFFAANDGIHGNELWKSDGTAAGTVLVKDVNPLGSSNPTQLTVVGGKSLFFRANDGTSGSELWKVINDFIVVGSDFGSLPTVNVYDGVTSQLIRTFSAYDPGFRGGVRVAVGDVNGDGTPDIITAPGPSGGPDIRIWDGNTGAMIGEFFAYDQAFTGGVFVASADVNRDGLADIITAPDQSGGPDIKVFSGFGGNLIQEFFAYDAHFLGGVRIAAADIDNNGTPDIITAPGPSGGADIRVWEGNTSALIQEFFAYDPSFLGGVYVAAGDINGDGRPDIITGPGSGTPTVKAFDGTDHRNVLASFLAYNPAFGGGVRVGVIGDVNNDGKQDIITAPGPSGGPEVKVFDSVSPNAVLDDFFAGDPANTNGIFVGGSHT